MKSIVKLIAILSVILSLPSTLLAEAPQAAPKNTFDFEYSGGNLENFEFELKKQSGVDIPITIPREIRRASIPPVVLKNIGKSPSAIMPAFAADQRLLGSISFTKQPSGSWLAVRSSPQPQFKAYNLKAISGEEWNKTLEEIMEAIHLGIGLTGQHFELELFIHQPLKLLLVSGPPSQLEVVEEIVKALSPETKSIALPGKK